MQLIKLLYACIFFGSIVYFILYGMVMLKRPIITISYEQNMVQLQREAVNRPPSYGNEVAVKIDKLEDIPRSNVSTSTILTSLKPAILIHTKQAETLAYEEENTGLVQSKLKDFLFNFKNDKDNDAVEELPTTEQPTIKPTTLPIENTQRNSLIKLMRNIDRLEKRNITEPLRECVRWKKGKLFIYNNHFKKKTKN